MSSIKFTNSQHWDAIENHLAQARGERFAFALTDSLTNGPSGPTLEVVGVILVEDGQVQNDVDGWCISDEALDRVHNEAVARGVGLIEFHNHGLGPPGFSRTDENALRPMVPYMLDLLGTPYGAAVWARGPVHAEWWRADGPGRVERGQFRSVVVEGERIRFLNAPAISSGRFSRQLPLIGKAAQAAIAFMKVAVVGAGGTGSQAALQLAYLGFRNIVILDDDVVEDTNLNRLVTADHVDLGLPKNLVAMRRMRSIDPLCRVNVHPGLSIDGEHPELEDVDLIVGCIDHDGPRNRLNQIAVDTRTPYIDIATGIDLTAVPPAVGGRVIFMLPGRPCLNCLGELDYAEVGRWGKSPEQQAIDRQHGYGTGLANPSVVYLNGLTVSAAFSEIAAWISGSRPPAAWLDIDLVGSHANPGTSVAPLLVGDPVASCIACSRRRELSRRLDMTG